MAAAGVTVGCATGPARYCPRDSVTRAEMATFLTRAINRAALSVELASSTGQTVTGSFQVGVSFARSVTAFGLGDVMVVNGRATRLAGSGSGYEVTIVPAAEGTVVVRIPEDVARDAAGNRNRPSGLLVRVFGSGGYRDGPGFDVWDRDAVVNAYRAEFEREQPDPGFTGNVAECDAGTTAQAFRNSVVRRVNWYRQMAGLDTVTERAEYSDAAQHAALMMSAQGSLSHYPGTDWACYMETGALGARSSNLGFGSSGIYGIEGYMQDAGPSNLAVGHRRWILYPQLLQIGTGNIPDASSHREAHALYVLGDRYQGDVREQRGFAAWPPAGYVPAETVWGRWSFQLPGADFAQADVTVTDQDGPIPVDVIDRNSSSGGRAVVWAVYGDLNSEQFPRFPDGDYCYTVTISNVRVSGTTQVPFQYFTCLLDPGTESGGVRSFPVWSPDGTRIAYLDNGIWVMNADGTNRRLLLLSSTRPAWSPDSTRIAYATYAPGIGGIWVVNADGTNRQQLATSGVTPVWSPDSTRIAYDSFSGGISGGIWVVNADGTNRQQLATSGGGPRWSPDGTRIAYLDDGIWVVNTDGTNRQQVTPNARWHAWSPDSTRIAYAIPLRGGISGGIWVVNADGTNRQQLATSGDGQAWSPDGTRIVYSNLWGIWVVNADGTNRQQLATFGSGLAWSPDGTRIAYTIYGSGIWVMNADGTNQQQLIE